MIDILLCVPSTFDFHSANLRQNPNFYPFFARFFGAGAVDFANNAGPGVFYLANCAPKTAKNFEKIANSPEIDAKSPEIDAKSAENADFRFKIGVFSAETLVSDCRNWDSLHLAGRIQKPVLFCTETGPFSTQNRPFSSEKSAPNPENASNTAENASKTAENASKTAQNGAESPKMAPEIANALGKNLEMALAAAIIISWDQIFNAKKGAKNGTENAEKWAKIRENASENGGKSTKITENASENDDGKWSGKNAESLKICEKSAEKSENGAENSEKLVKKSENGAKNYENSPKIEISLDKVWKNCIRLSYIGDIRGFLRAEDPKKVRFSAVFYAFWPFLGRFLTENRIFHPKMQKNSPKTLEK
jgi:hypothetical protein